MVAQRVLCYYCIICMMNESAKGCNLVHMLVFGLFTNYAHISFNTIMKLFIPFYYQVASTFKGFFGGKVFLGPYALT